MVSVSCDSCHAYWDDPNCFADQDGVYICGDGERFVDGLKK